VPTCRARAGSEAQCDLSRLSREGLMERVRALQLELAGAQAERRKLHNELVDMKGQVGAGGPCACALCMCNLLCTA
jgi:uncharacterized small protein (DUF1192 family)